MKKNLLKISAFVSSLLAVLLVFVFPKLIFAQTSGTGINVTFEPPVKFDNIQDLLKKLLETLLQIAIPVIAGFIVWSGFLFIKAQGKKDELEKARRTLLFTMIGAGVVFGSWLLAKLIVATVSSLRDDAGV